MLLIRAILECNGFSGSSKNADALPLADDGFSDIYGETLIMKFKKDLCGLFVL